VNNYSIGSLSPGIHTITITADATGVIAESNENDNSYTKTINIQTAWPTSILLSITRSGNQFVISWPTNLPGYTLQSTTNLSPAVWTTVSPAPVVANTNYAVTNVISGTQQFFRLSQ